MQAGQYYDPNALNQQQQQQMQQQQMQQQQMLQQQMLQQQQQQLQQTTVPNVMMDETQNMEGVQLQQGGYVMPTPMPRGDVGASYDPTGFPAQVPPLPQFDIPDPIMRRAFVTKVLTILLIQNIIVLPVIEIFILVADEPVHLAVYIAIWLLAICIFALMYTFSDARRNSPMNLVGLFVVTLFWTVQEGVFATQIGSHLAFISQLIIIAQLISLILYTKQHRFRFNNVNTILLVVFVFIICVCIVTIVSPTSLHAIGFGSALNVIYFVYDIQLMMSGHHGYHLQPEEHLFGAANIYADIPNFQWRAFRAVCRCLDRVCGDGCDGGDSCFGDCSDGD